MTKSKSIRSLGQSESKYVSSLILEKKVTSLSSCSQEELPELEPESAGTPSEVVVDPSEPKDLE